MRHLSALDALFLHLETPDTPMHVGSLMLLEQTKRSRGKADSYNAIRDHIASRMHLAPVFSRRLAFMPLDLANPVWLHEDEVDLDYHMRRLV
ncbi:MAG: wax ester/triacylglycerol synthase domain-containing protein, partial [Terriglobales bacterium]